MHGMSVEIRLKDYLDSSVNPARVKKGLPKLTWKQYERQISKQSDRVVKVK